MDRQIVYPGSIPLDTDILNVQRNVMVALGYLAQSIFGTSVVVDGLQCVPFGLGVSILPGSATQFGVVDSVAFGSLPSVDAPLVKVGVNLLSQWLATPAPAEPGQAISYLVEASFLESDGTPLVLPYYNAANPAQPFAGASNNGVAQNTQRLQSVQLLAKAGGAAVAGSQTVPPTDTGWIALAVVTVNYGQDSVQAGDIAPVIGAPYINFKLPTLTPGTSNLAVFGPESQGVWSVPAGITNVRVKLWGGGGAGGSGFGGSGGGGSGGGYCEGYYAVSPGENFAVTVGEGGVGAGTSGGSSSFGNLASATGGEAGESGTSDSAGAGGATGGGGTGSGYVVVGTPGAAGFSGAGFWVSGPGGASFGGAGALGVIGNGSVDGQGGIVPGGGGSGGVGGGLGGSGGAGLVLVEW